MSLGIFVEGESDRHSLPIILGKLGRRVDQCRKVKYFLNLISM